MAGFISYFSELAGRHAHLKASLERAGKYKDMISKDLKDAGLPQDLIYLAVAESGFQPQVVNRSSGAGGMWQFMPFQGAYGLERNGWFDERFDPDQASLAYARYMKALYDQFGDWYLAMAAYNWGPGNVQRAVMVNRVCGLLGAVQAQCTAYRDKNTCPASLRPSWPRTRSSMDWKTWCLIRRLSPIPRVSITRSICGWLADVTGAPLSEIVALNPSLLRMTTPGAMDFDLHLPAGTREVFQKRIVAIPEDKRASWRFHVVKPGESLDSIASNFHVGRQRLSRPTTLPRASRSILAMNWLYRWLRRLPCRIPCAT